MSNCNDALLKSTGETDLLQEICRVCVDDGDYKLAWVVFFESDPVGLIRVIAQHGLVVENVMSLIPTHGQDPFNLTFSTKKPVILQNICKDKVFASWQETATKYGFESFISLPIVIDGNVTGVLALLSSEPFSFKTDEVFLLNKLSNNLAYGIKALRLREEQNQLEEELRISEGRYKLAQRSASIGSWEWDLSTDEVFWSDEIFHFIEKQPDEYAPSKSALSDFVIPEDRAVVEQVLCNAQRTEKPFDVEFRIRVISGNLKWINAKGNVIKDTFGKPILVTGTMQDVSHRKEIEEVLKSTNDKYKLISGNSTDVISVVDVKTERFTFISPSVLKLRGYKTEEVMQQTLADVFTPDSYQKAKSYLQQSIPDVIDGQPSISFVMELDQVRKDGITVPTEITFTQAYDDSGNLQVISIARDITQRKKSEMELREERNLFQVLMDNIPDGIYFKNLKSRFLRINKAEASIFGLRDPAKAVGKTDFDFFTDEHAQAAYNDEQEIIQSGKPIYNFEEKETFPDGHIRWISTSKLPFRNSKGKIIGTFGISHDITHRKQMELSLQQRVKELETVYQISNRIRTGETVKELLQDLLAETLNVIQSSDGGIFLFEHSENKLVLDAAIGWFKQLANLTLEPNEGINGYVFSTNEPYIAQDIAADQFLASKVKNVVPQGQSGGFFPIQCSEGIIGVLDVYVPHPRIISENEQRLLIIIAQMAGGFIQRSRLTEKLSHINTDLQIEIDEKNVYQSLLAAEKELLSTTLMSLGEGVIITDKDGLIVLFNKAAESITGYQSLEIFEKPLYSVFQIIDPKTNSIMPEIIDNLYQMSRAQVEEPNYKPPTLITRSGERILISSSISMLKNPDGQFMGHVIVFQNVTEKQLADAQSALSQKMEAIGQLAAGIAHEINTPIQYIGDNLRFLQKSISRFSEMVEACHLLENDQPVRQDCVDHLLEIKKQTKIEHYIKESPVAVQEALDGVERVRKIVLAMREFSHPSEKEKKLADINHGIETTVVISRNEWKYSVELETDLDPELPPVFCQIDEINQVILNMIINSVHAIEEVIPPGSDQKGKINISTKKAGDHVIIKIRDSGKGIPEEIKQRIFDPFFTTKGVGKGTGQGLSLAHQIIIKKHHGTINVDSAVGTGTTFTIDLPIEEPE